MAKGRALDDGLSKLVLSIAGAYPFRWKKQRFTPELRSPHGQKGTFSGDLLQAAYVPHAWIAQGSREGFQNMVEFETTNDFEDASQRSPVGELASRTVETVKVYGSSGKPWLRMAVDSLSCLVLMLSQPLCLHFCS